MSDHTYKTVKYIYNVQCSNGILSINAKFACKKGNKKEIKDLLLTDNTKSRHDNAAKTQFDCLWFEIQKQKDLSFLHQNSRKLLN